MRISIKINYIYNTALSVLNVIFPLITFPYVSRVIGPENLGKISFVQAFCGYFIMLSTFGVPVLGIREIAKSRDDKAQLNKTFSNIILISFVSTLVSLILYFIVIINVTEIKAEMDLAIVFGLSIFVNAFSIDWFYSGVEEYRYITIRSGLVKLISVILTFFLIKNSSDYVVYATLGVGVVLVSNIINVLYSRKFVDFSLTFLEMKFLKTLLKPMFLFFLGYLASSIYKMMDIVMLGFLVEDKYVSFYSIDKRLVSLVTLITISLGSVLIPRLSYYIKKNMVDEYNKLIDKSLNFIYFISLPAVVAFLFLSKNILFILGGEKYIGASASLSVMSFHILLTGISSFIGYQIIVPFNKERWLVIANVAGATVNILLNYFLIPVYLHNAAAMNIVLSELVIVVVQMYFIRDYFRLQLINKEFFKYFFASVMLIPIILIVKLLIVNMFIAFFVSCLFSFITYFVLLYYLKDTIVLMVIDYVKKNLLKFKYI